MRLCIIPSFLNPTLLAYFNWHAICHTPLVFLDERASRTLVSSIAVLNFVLLWHPLENLHLVWFSSGASPPSLSSLPSLLPIKSVVLQVNTSNIEDTIKSSFENDY